MWPLCCLSNSTWLMLERNKEVFSQIFRPLNNYECTCIFEAHLQGCIYLSDPQSRQILIKYTCFDCLLNRCWLNWSQFTNINLLNITIFIFLITFHFDSGVIFINPCIDAWTRVDTRARAFSVPPQQVLYFSVYACAVIPIKCMRPEI